MAEWLFLVLGKGGSEHDDGRFHEVTLGRKDTGVSVALHGKGGGGKEKVSNRQVTASHLWRERKRTARYSLPQFAQYHQPKKGGRGGPFSPNER